ncbi:hypothetical protein PT286_07590 [Neisseriaceae bacterium ESL0693]|nr:hypothetical protein [Neisseriaceae bacterium ESL0693]
MILLKAGCFLWPIQNISLAVGDISAFMLKLESEEGKEADKSETVNVAEIEAVLDALG